MKWMNVPNNTGEYDDDDDAILLIINITWSW